MGMDAKHPINRLTEREKEALRAWLNHKTAKEIALDLGISHHAVEKRLKMARTKLDAGSTLQAARMLAEAEGPLEEYQQTVTAPPDLPPAPDPRPSWHHRPLVLGGLAMFTLTILGLALATAYPADVPTEIELDGDLSKLFAHHDTNGSGFLENPESPLVEITFLDDTGPEPLDGVAAITGGVSPEQIAEFYATADTDSDDRISLAEFSAWSKAQWAAMGIEVKTIVKVLPAPES
jgi:DNA-binding CsgD family transcriptional regulator